MSFRRPLSVITATPPGFNPGMLASQVAARWFLHRHGLDREATFLRITPMENRLACLDAEARAACLRRVDDGNDYRLLLQADQLAGTIPLFWGDLLHMRQYLESIRSLTLPSQAAPEELLLLANAPEDLLGRAVSFGTTFLYHGGSDLAAEPPLVAGRFATAFRRFVSHARLIMPRDVVSAAQLAALLPEAPLFLGLDATQLFCGAPWREAFPDGTDRSLVAPDRLLCFFARGRHEIADLGNAVGSLAREFGRPVHWLPWGDRLSFPRLEEYEHRLGVESIATGAIPRLSALLEAIAAATCVLTDTYHVAVLAWSLGTPALMVRGPHWPGDFNAVVDKRYVFYVQHGLQELFLNDARDADGLTAFIRRAVVAIADGTLLRWYQESVGRRARACERLLADALCGGRVHG